MTDEPLFDPVAPAPRIGYLTSMYPAVSHTFIEREVRALRARGLEIATFSIRAATPDNVLSTMDREAYATTESILPVTAERLVVEHARRLRTAPRRYLSTLALALSLGAGARGRLKQLFYFAEAVLLAERSGARGVEHFHAHFGSPSADIVMLAARLLGCPWSFTLHGTDINHGDRRLLAKKVRDATFVVCVGEFARRKVAELAGAEQMSKVHVVHCGLDASAFPPRPTRTVSERFAVISVGRLDREKGQHVLIEALPRLREMVPATITFVGEGRERPRLENLAAALGVQEHVRFAGSVSQERIQAFYSEADAFCLTSFSEGIPVVLMEAMALGVPVVATDVGGVAEIVEDGVTGLLVEAGSASAAAVALARLATTPRLGSRLAAAARAHVLAKFDVENSARSLESLFRLGGVDR